MHRGGIDAGDHGGGADLDSQVSELVFGIAGKMFGIGGQDSRTAFNEQDSGFPWIDIANSWFIAWRAISARVPASSTPVGPPPTTTKCRST